MIKFIDLLKKYDEFINRNVFRLINFVLKSVEIIYLIIKTLITYTETLIRRKLIKRGRIFIRNRYKV
jgi:hypothetical protein